MLLCVLPFFPQYGLTTRLVASGDCVATSVSVEKWQCFADIDFEISNMFKDIEVFFLWKRLVEASLLCDISVGMC